MCCPDGGLTSRTPKQSRALPEKNLGSASSTSKPPEASEERDGAYMDVMVFDQRNATQQRESVHSRVLPELAELGIRGPFNKSTRRPRRKFSAYDDKNLLKGFEKYGPVWHAMRDDTDLGFATRHPTDLRDRFRIKYPEKYAKAGYKLKAKEDRIVRERTGKWHGQEPWPRLHSTRTEVQVPHRGRHKSQLGVDAGRVLGKSGLAPTTTSYVPTSSGLKSLGLGQYLSDPLPIVLDDGSVSEDGDGEKSPITLNRNILRWADANPSSSFAFAPPPANTHGINHGTGDMPLQVFVANDGIHINPLATLKLPSTTFYGNTQPIANAWPTCNSSSGLLNQSTISGGVTNVSWDTRMVSGRNTTAAHSVSSAPATSSLVQPRTPNLPTIVFPHVPAASARTTVHNLPTPADLLLGIDLEKSEPQALGITLDDALRHAM